MFSDDVLLLNASNTETFPVYPYAFIQVPAIARRAGIEVVCKDLLGIASERWTQTIQALIEQHNPAMILITLHVLQTLFAISALLIQTVLVLHFAALRWRPRWQQQWGWLVYAMSLPGLVLGALFWVNNQPWYYWLATLLFAAWAALGYTVDILHPVNWRMPVWLPVFIPYVTLYMAAQFAFWIPLWFIWKGYWIMYAVLYAINTVLNISSHFVGQKTHAARPV